MGRRTVQGLKKGLPFPLGPRRVGLSPFSVAPRRDIPEAFIEFAGLHIVGLQYTGLAASINDVVKLMVPSEISLLNRLAATGRPGCSPLLDSIYVYLTASYSDDGLPSPCWRIRTSQTWTQGK